MKKTIVLAFATFCLVSLSNGQSKVYAKTSEGKTYSVRLKKISGNSPSSAWITDEFTIRSGKFRSKVMSKSEHLEDAKCKFSLEFSLDTVSEKTIHFEATGKNPGGSTIFWSGTVKGENISGAAVWKTTQGIQSYTFSGKAKQENSPALAGE